LNKLEMFDRYNYSSLFSPFVSYEEKVLPQFI